MLQGGVRGPRASETCWVRGVLVTVPEGLTDLQSGEVMEFEGDGGDAFLLVVPGSP